MIKWDSFAKRNDILLGYTSADRRKKTTQSKTLLEYQITNEGKYAKWVQV